MILRFFCKRLKMTYIYFLNIDFCCCNQKKINYDVWQK